MMMMMMIIIIIIIRLTMFYICAFLLSLLAYFSLSSHVIKLRLLFHIHNVMYAFYEQ